jgi:cytochrome b
MTMAESASNAKISILVWDSPTRVFHWLLVLSFAGAYATAESERWRLAHITLGYTMGGLVAFRVLWGFMGTRYARFVSFVRGPAAVFQYLRTLLSGKPPHHIGHNPAGAVAIVLMLVSSAAIVASGWAIYNDVGGNWLGALHNASANFMVALVGAHLAGVAVATWMHRENLLRAMWDGKKQGAPSEGIRKTGWLLLLSLVIVVSVIGFWWLQWRSAPTSVAVPRVQYQQSDLLGGMAAISNPMFT